MNTATGSPGVCTIVMSVVKECTSVNVSPSRLSAAYDTSLTMPEGHCDSYPKVVHGQLLPERILRRCGACANGVPAPAADAATVCQVQRDICYPKIRNEPISLASRAPRPLA